MNAQLKRNLISQLNSWRGGRDITVFAREYELEYYSIYNVLAARRNLSAQLSRALLPVAVKEHPPAAKALFHWVTGLDIVDGDVSRLRPTIPNNISTVRACLKEAYQQVGTVTDAAMALELAIPTAYYLSDVMPSRPIKQPEPATGRKLCRGFYKLGISAPISNWLSFSGGVYFKGELGDLALL